MRIVSVVAMFIAGCYQSHGPLTDRLDATVHADAPIAIDAPPVLDAGSCGGETNSSLLLVQSIGAGTFLELISSAVVGFGECGTGAIVLGFDPNRASMSPSILVSIPMTADAPIDRDGDWPCTTHATFGPDESCVISGHITGYVYRGFYLQLTAVMLGGVGYSAGGTLSAPVCDLQICP